MRASRPPQPVASAARQLRPVAPAPAVPRAASYPTPAANSRPASALPARRKPAQGRRRNGWLMALAGGVITFSALACLIVTLGAFMLYGSGNILPGVRVAGVTVGNLSQAEAASELAATWASRGVLVNDGEQTVPVEPALLGLTLDADASARAAFQVGRSTGGIGMAVRALLGPVDAEPVINIVPEVAAAGLQDLAARVDRAPVNAGVQMVNGQAQPRAAVPGRALDVGQTLARLQRNPARELADGRLDLVMRPVQPAITDAGPLVEAAAALLSSPLYIRAWDPIEDDTIDWTVAPEAWSQWLTGEADDASPYGLRLSLDASPLRDYLREREAALEADEYLSVDDAAAALQNAIAQGRTDAIARVYHQDTTHVVQPGDTVISIAWDYGVPYPWILQANPGADAGLNAGQTITVPSADNFMEYEPVYGKRIVVSISEQKVWVYEHGNLKWEWIASTGIQSSPTWPGIYQIISHEPNAYAGNWDLYMPNFLGVYRPIPGSDFTNGFHGFPTRGGWQLLWTNSLGTRVTYGCILLSDENARSLYEWAEEGVVVEIRA